MIIEYDDIIEQLRAGEMLVTFTKADGSTRIMRCTLNTNYLAEDTNPNGHNFSSKEAIRAFDLDLQEWRSFRLDSIINISNIGE